MKQNTLVVIVGAVAVYYLWKKSQEEKETTHATKPMMLDPMESDVTTRPIAVTNPINLPNLGIGSTEKIAQSGIGSGVICERNGRISGCVRECADGDKVVGNCTLSSALARR